MTGRLFKKLIVLCFLVTVFGAGAATWLNFETETETETRTETRAET
ncbi:MAG: hypothetical protein ACI85Z_000957 [Rheinheimera aquimaris]|jgi:hypothetical protein